jgi:hypothetical protein
VRKQIADDQPQATFVFNHEGQEYVRLEDYERLRAMLRWIPVGERKPQTCENVLAFCFGEIGVATRASDGWYWDQEGYQEIEPSHWRPLPEPPAELHS